MRALLLILLLTAPAYAVNDQYVVDAGIGISNSAKMRTASLGIQEDLWDAVKQRGTIGFWGGGPGTSSFFAAGQLGFEVNNRGTVASIFSGPALISNTDSMLGSYLEFVTDLHLGLQDGNMNYLGLFYRHVSSAGLAEPNVGRDIVGLEIKF